MSISFEKVFFDGCKDICDFQRKLDLNSDKLLKEYSMIVKCGALMRDNHFDDSSSQSLLNRCKINLLKSINLPLNDWKLPIWPTITWVQAINDNKIYVLVDNYPIIFQNGSYLHIMVYDLCIQLKVKSRSTHIISVFKRAY